jgi:hypothetical protein
VTVIFSTTKQSLFLEQFAMLMADIFATILFVKPKSIFYAVFIIKLIISIGFLAMINIFEKLLK